MRPGGFRAYYLPVDTHSKRRVTSMNKRRHRLMVTILLLLLMPLVSLAQSGLERVRKSGELRVGTDATYPPFETAEGGQFSGFDIDLATAIARELGVKVRFINASFDGIFPALQNGTFDVVMSSVYNTIDLALLDLRNRRIDAVVCDAPVLKYMIFQSFRDLKTVGRRFTDEKFGIALGSGSEDLQQEINLALKKIRETREYDRIHEKWFGEAAERAAEQEAQKTKPRVFDTGIIRRTFAIFLRGVSWTARLAFLSFFLGLPVGLLLALMRVQSSYLIAAPAAVYVEVMRGTPLLVQILFIYFVLPYFGIYLPAFTSGVIALTLNSAAYISEIFRAGILSIDAGQMEAARALGMTYPQAMRRIILPQTFRRVVPPLTNEGIALLKDSSLVSVIGLTELARTGQELASRYAAPLTIWPVVAVFYLLLTFPLTRVAEYLERRWRPVTRS